MSNGLSVRHEAADQVDATFVSWQKELRAIFDRAGKETKMAYLPLLHGLAVMLIASWNNDHEVIRRFEKLSELFDSLQKWVNKVDLKDPEQREVVAHLFDEELQILVDTQTGSIKEFITPERVVNLMLDLANLQPGDKVYDPCFGVGGLIVAAARRGASVFGFEKSLIPFSIGFCRTLLAGVDRPSLKNSDVFRAKKSLLPDYEKKNGFDCILAVPPLVVARENEKPILKPILEHVMAKLCPGGRAIVAMPENMLSAPDWKKLRQKLLSDYDLEAVVSLPSRAFMPSETVDGCLLLFRRPVTRTRAFRVVEITPEAWGALPDLTSTVQIQPQHEPSKSPALPGVEIWDIPVLDLRQYRLDLGKPGDDLEDILDTIQVLDPSMEVEPLKDVADVVLGLRYQLDLTTEQGDKPGVVAGLLRVMDIDPTGGVRQPSLFLTEQGKANLDKRDFGRFEEVILHPNDIVITNRGKVGQVGLVPSAVDPVYSLPMLPGGSMALVRAKNKIIPEFLSALLHSPTYKNYWQKYAFRLKNPILPMQLLETVRIPVPTIRVQKAVIGEIKGTGDDAMAVLIRLLSTKREDHVEEWLEKSLVANLAAGRSVPGSRTDTLTSATEEILSLTDQMTSGLTGRWTAIMRDAAVVFDGIASTPIGAGRLTILQVALSRLREAQHTLNEAEGPVVNRLRSFTQAIIKLSEDEVLSMQKLISLDIDMEPAEVTLGTTSEVRLRLKNSSDVPLRHLTIETRPAVGTGQIPYLAEGETRDIPLTVYTDAAEPFHISVSWQARRLDGKAVNGEAEKSLLVLSVPDTRFGDLGFSPYITGNPVDRREMFFGRDDVMERIKAQLGAGTHGNVVLLEGNRRTGKSSILKQLKNVEALPDWIPVYCDLQGTEGHETKEGVPTNEFFKLLTVETGKALYDAGVETWFPGLDRPSTRRPFKLDFALAGDQVFTTNSQSSPFLTFQRYIESAIEAVHPKRILLMLDEFDKLQGGIDSGITSPQVPENIRHLLQNQPALSAIITGSRRLKRLREEYWSVLFGLGYRVGISAIPVDEARRLVTQPVEGRLRFLPTACDRLVSLCACHPFLVQSLCNRVFERVSGGERTVTLDTVEEAATDMVRDNEHFQTLWDYAGSARRRLLVALCDHWSEQQKAVDINLLSVKLAEFKIPLRRVSYLVDDLTELRELELLDFDDHRRAYQLSVPLMSRWLRTHTAIGDLAASARKEVGRA